MYNEKWGRRRRYGLACTAGESYARAWPLGLVMSSPTSSESIRSTLRKISSKAHLA